ncbi:MAG: hypothetical protein E6K54_07870 [Gammaproteobacteria bacterium]|nr:MAG: hypothetical protein E6K54_07870 [Gammaproteobacteria bacterium]
MFSYGKLDNPVNKHLKCMKVTNGLNPSDLIDFIKCMLKLSGDLKVPDSVVLDLCVGHSSGPLMSKLLECRSKGLSVMLVHSELVRYFIPTGMLDNLRVNFVNRPQKVGEDLALYIADIKENARVLLCNLTEFDLVQLIKIGIAPSERNRLLFMPNPTSFNDLDMMCIQAQNMAYADGIRMSENVRPRYKHVNFNVNSSENVVRPKLCYICQKPGHIAKFCYRRNQPNRESKN